MHQVPPSAILFFLPLEGLLLATAVNSLQKLQWPLSLSAVYSESDTVIHNVLITDWSSLSIKTTSTNDDMIIHWNPIVQIIANGTSNHLVCKLHLLCGPLHVYVMFSLISHAVPKNKMTLVHVSRICGVQLGYNPNNLLYFSIHSPQFFVGNATSGGASSPAQLRI